MQAAFNYFTLLRTSKFEDFHFEELVKLADIRFRFLEKKPPGDYATALTEHMAWPVNPDMILAAPRLTWMWENDEDKKQVETKIAEYLTNMRIEESRVVLMASKDDLTTVHSNPKWEKEPWYGTEYDVQRWDKDFIQKVYLPP